ncbi:uncharacterized protein N7482_009198 [Penicillium canariense]|uniref:Uncharacterized protein n=1 Tax=Penicillium canariense TaxID=189055 RepID=A0A9W9LG20_9EURO|nr:uncharacterized protein N7482_009198 [Penicillium canariense]KAJ5152720.1 hypothetical protein N7482_009198 [Penicillium canariense]
MPLSPAQPGMCPHPSLMRKTNKLTSEQGAFGLGTTILIFREGASVLAADISDASLATALDKVNSIVPPESRSQKVETKGCRRGLDAIFEQCWHRAPEGRGLGECLEDIWNRTMDTSVKGVWYGFKHAVRSFRKHGRKRASVIKTASMVALVGAATP